MLAGLSTVFNVALQMPKNLTEFDDLLDAVLDPVLWVVTARCGDEQSGLIATFVPKASLVPALPRMVAAIARHHYTTRRNTPR
jgi:flavin reductase (DIM6/NTAB) family NADH-FMN oxidoreductase RutF